MKRIVCILWILILNAFALPSVEEVERLWENREEVDEISWKDPARGTPFRVRIIGVSENEIHVEKQLSAGWTRRSLAIAELGSIRFQPFAWEGISNPEIPHADVLRRLWEKRKPLIGKASGVSECGISFAVTLRKIATESSWKEAESILKSIQRHELSPVLKHRAAQEIELLEFSRLLASHDEAKKQKRAWEITETDASAEMMLLATAFLADVSISQLAAIQKEHPRWMDDDEITPLRNQRYHLALDLALYPSLFCGTFHKEASEGLVKAIRIYQMCDQLDLVKQTIDDLHRLYPDSKAAKAFKRAETPSLSEPIPSTQENNQPAAPETSEPPTRYNLFKDES